MKTEKINYSNDGVTFNGYVAYPEAQGKRPAVIVAHAWRGQDDFARKQAEKLASWGYVGFAADVFGDGKEAKTDQEAEALMLPLFMDRPLLQKRIGAAFEKVSSLPQVDSSKIAAIGFCFGGLTVIELLRSGKKIKGAVSLHGLLGNSMGGKEAKLAPIQPIQGALFVLHGNDDPMVSLDDILNFQKEMNGAKVDWQMHLFGHAVHAFTNPQAHKPGVMDYNEKISNRAFKLTEEFLKEVLA